MGSNALKHAELKCEEFPLPWPAFFSQTAISRYFFLIFNDTDKLRYTIMPLKRNNFYYRVILSYVILCVLDVNNIFGLQL